MENNLIMFNSMTTVMKSRDLLRRNGIVSRTVRTPAHLRNRSCGYSLVVNREFDRALEILKNNRISIFGVDAVDFP